MLLLCVNHATATALTISHACNTECCIIRSNSKITEDPPSQQHFSIDWELLGHAAKILVAGIIKSFLHYLCYS